MLCSIIMSFLLQVYATLTRYKNALIAANTEKAQKETKLLSKINFLEQTLRAEQVSLILLTH